jgi:hypothetical protein
MHFSEAVNGLLGRVHEPVMLDVRVHPGASVIKRGLRVACRLLDQAHGFA